MTNLRASVSNVWGRRASYISCAGVPEGTAAFLDVASEHGSVRNGLTPTEGPVQDESTAEIHASTGFGDVVVRRP